MSQEIRDLLKDYDIESVEIADITYPASFHCDPPHPWRLLVLPGDNIMELMEETLDEHESLPAFVQHSMEKVSSLSFADSLRHSLEWLFASNALPAAYPPLEQLSATQLYEAYRELENTPYLNETPIRSKQVVPVPDSDWAEARQEDGAFWLTLPEGSEYKAALIIPMGGYNECPLPVDQATVFREWQQQYGAIPIAVNDSTWILQAQHLPRTDGNAIELARQHVLFCPYVLEGFESIGEYADYLKQHPIWYFFWD
ncbi:DUF4253 domain-containing protein [Paenibacillus sp. WLX1005]|uniref:DUF4253 domain-containing protein n=1 Tax=Paenibacillus sp. WLX1005 TaxID=3243766 RepID=UPI00398439E2